MASVTSLDKDLRKMRLDKYTPAAANEFRSWIEEVLGEKLPATDLLDGLKDGVALCKLINLAAGSPTVKFKKSAMPFVQMENISHFLRACRNPPVNLQEHDMFLTVDLYEKKDPAQVLQCLGAFSRAAHAANPSAFPSSIGPKQRGGVVSPQGTGPTGPPTSRPRGLSNVSTGSAPYGQRSGLVPSKTGDPGSRPRTPLKSPTGESLGSPSVSTWSKKNHEGVTSPAWNIAQYGYMGGASQGNLGIVYGGRRQITSAGPHVPTAAEKERKRKEQEAEAERQRQQMEEEERARKAEAAAEEDRARVEEERRWEDETRRQRAEEKRQAEEEKRRWEEEERQWKLTNERRRQEEEEAEARMNDERRRSRSKSDVRLRGQFLSQYQAEQAADSGNGGEGYGDRVKQLEKELERARQRERQYEEDRQKRSQKRDASKNRARSRSRARMHDRTPSRQDSWSRDEREYLRTQWDRTQEPKGDSAAPPPPPRPLPVPSELKPQRTGEARPLPVPGRQVRSPPAPASPEAAPKPPPRPLPNHPANNNNNNNNRAPMPPAKNPAYAREPATQQRPKSASKPGMSLLEREMELERQRQREWEESQQETAKAVPSGDGVAGIGGGIGGRWDVGQWSGFTGGDSQNKGSAGIGAGRRQIVGPRPLPGRP
ncbi:hypothetical protein F4780DRAFT_760036 [Xylariomycetidae sp. FL0641]|nr:hypothetical protein F4780DRAFT_760036 [Xylariomycetidae sp. FL0641]